MSEMGYRRRLRAINSTILFHEYVIEFHELADSMIASSLPVAEQLKQLLRRDDPLFRPHVLSMIDLLEMKELAPHLIDLFHATPDEETQFSLLDTLRYLNHEQTAPFLLNIFQQHPSTRFRITAAYGFYNHPYPAAIPALIAAGCSSDEDIDLRRDVLEVLSEQKDRSLLPLFLSWLTHEEALMRLAALWGIEHVGDLSLVSHIELLFNDHRYVDHHKVSSWAKVVIKLWRSNAGEEVDWDEDDE